MFWIKPALGGRPETRYECRGLERETARKGGESTEGGLIRGGEQINRPANRVTHRLLSFGRIARPTREDGQRAVKPSEQALWREDPGSRGGELDRQWHAVQAVADLSDLIKTGRTQPEVRIRFHRSCDEERYRRRFGRTPHFAPGRDGRFD